MAAHPTDPAPGAVAAPDVPLSALSREYAGAVPELSVPWAAEVPPDPTLVWLNEPLARELGLDPDRLRGPEGIALLTGRIGADGMPDASGPRPEEPWTTAQAYAGHQFGRPNPVLGDGRAVLLGELRTDDGRLVDLHLKGSGRTPFARGGDGRAPLGPMLREAVVGESMHALGVPTTRALGVLTTGERIAPRRGVTPEPGALLVRVAASHLRVGTLEYAAWHEDLPVRRALVDHAIARHHPPAADAPVPALGLLEAVTAAQAELLAQWMLLGFVHGVMNTDNMTLSGEGIDYGPCAYLDRHRRGAVFSSIDHQGRYAYGNQPGIALWNLSRLAESLLELLDPDHPEAAVDAATAVLEGFEPRYRAAHARGLREKLGLRQDAPEDEVEALGAELFALLEERGADHTGFFRALAEDEGSAERLLRGSATTGDDGSEGADGGPGPGASRADEATDPVDPDARVTAWWESRRRWADPDPAAASARLRAANPVVIPRNAHLESALRAAELGDLGPACTLLDAVARPFAVPEQAPWLAEPGEGGDELVTFCGT